MAFSDSFRQLRFSIWRAGLPSTRVCRDGRRIPAFRPGWIMGCSRSVPQSAERAYGLSARVVVPGKTSRNRISVARAGSSKSGLWAEFSNR